MAIELLSRQQVPSLQSTRISTNMDHPAELAEKVKLAMKVALIITQQETNERCLCN